MRIIGCSTRIEVRLFGGLLGSSGSILAVLLVVIGPRSLALGVVAAHPVAVLVDFEVAAIFLGQFATFGGLTDREADTATLEVEVDDLDPQLLARRDNLLWSFDVVSRHFGDVHETLDSIADLDERTEWHELRDATVDKLADFM
jgi:hypothetical protein